MRIAYLLLLMFLMQTSVNYTDAQNITADTAACKAYIGYLPSDTINFDFEQVEVNKKKIKPKRRIVAAFLCLTLGPFGMHRAYLGTEPHVIAAYTVTLGGGIGFVPIVDLFEIVFTKDISAFKNNERFFMWIK